MKQLAVTAFIVTAIVWVLLAGTVLAINILEDTEPEKTIVQNPGVATFSQRNTYPVDNSAREDIETDLGNTAPEQTVIIPSPVEVPHVDDNTLTPGMPDSIENYVDDVADLNQLLDENPAFTDIIRSLNEEGVNIVADDVSVVFTVTDDGMIDEIFIGTDDQYNTVVIHDDLADFLEDAEAADSSGDYFALFSTLDMPLSYYVKIPQVVAAL